MLKHENGQAFIEVLNTADEDNSGSVDIQELMAAIVDTNSVIGKDQIQETFEKYDDDNGGSLDYEEI